MSDTITEAIPHGETLSPHPEVRASIQWIKRIVLFVILLWVASEAVSLAIQHTRLRRILTAHLQSAFGRPVEVGSYDFSVLDGFALEANSVTVGEDPRFGQEYFLRADSITVRLRWISLLRGRIEFGTVSLEKPSLNLVRNAAGDWNLAQWLPRPGAVPAGHNLVGPALPSSSLRFARVEVDGGRINFKDGDEKLPFAFVDVKGTAETDRPGRWRVNLEVQPWRAALVMQQTGKIRLSGDFGGTSSRLLPAMLDVDWSDASLSDVLRLAKGDDDGVRGLFALQASAHTDDTGAWILNTRAQIRRIRRWDLVERQDNPSLAVSARIGWTPSAPFFEITQASLDAPHSHASVNGRLYWRRDTQLSKIAIPPVQVTYADADLDMADILAWLRAFHPGVADNLAVRGFVHTHTALSQWPPRIVSAEVSSPGAELSVPNLRRPTRLGEVRIRYEKGAITLAPVAVSFGSADDAIRFESAPPKGHSASSLPAAHITANVSDVHDLLVAAEALGWNLAKGWDISGPARADLLWQGGEPWRTMPVGFINWGAGPGVATVRVPFLNLPIGNINAVSQWKAGSRHISIVSADAFGAHWTGVLDRVTTDDGGWKFSLAADHLAAADLDRWMNPAWRQSFLGRVLPFLNSRPAPAAPENLRASGRLTVDQLALTPLAIRKLQGDLSIDGRHLTFTSAAGQFYGGQISGSLDANLVATPSYHVDLSFSHIDAASLVAAAPILAGVTAKTVSGQISIRAAGPNRGDLISSVTCQGSASASGIRLLNAEPPAAGSSRAVPTEFSLADASFSCAQRRVVFQRLSLTTGVQTSEVGSGSIDFSGNLDLHFQSHSDLVGGLVPPPPSFNLTGTLAAPRVARTPPSAQRTR